MSNVRVPTFVAIIALAIAVGAPAQAADLLDDFGGPVGFGVNVLDRTDDGSELIDLTRGFPDGLPLGGGLVESAYVFVNGAFSTLPPAPFLPGGNIPPSTGGLFRVFGADHDTRSVPEGSPHENRVYWHLDPEVGLVVTWYNVAGFDVAFEQRNAYQLLLRPWPDGRVVVELRYKRCDWVNSPTDPWPGAEVAFRTGPEHDFWAYENSATEAVVEVCEDSNVGQPGLYRIVLDAEGYIMPDVFVGCGDGVLDTGEECDDGNFDALDGCTATCIEERDRDRDGVWNGDDNCFRTPNADQADEDRDGVGDRCDNCPTLANADQLNSDADRDGDACDVCPFDLRNDTDADDVCYALDNCPTVFNPDQRDADDDGLGDACDDDADNDGVINACDNCLRVANPDQANRDADADWVGDACDDDADNDGVRDEEDCDPDDGLRWVMLETFVDEDGDGIGEGIGEPGTSTLVCLGRRAVSAAMRAGDNCPRVFNPLQLDTDEDGLGDACDPDRDEDGVFDDGDGSGVAGDEPCPFSGIAVDCDDNCLWVSNAGQVNSDGRSVGDACDGDLDGDGFPDEEDACPEVFERVQRDADADGIGDVCDADTDGDRVDNVWDLCPNVEGDMLSGCRTPIARAPAELCREPDAEGEDAGADASSDAGADAGGDAGADAGGDAGADGGIDADTGADAGDVSPADTDDGAADAFDASSTDDAAPEADSEGDTRDGGAPGATPPRSDAAPPGCAAASPVSHWVAFALFALLQSPRRRAVRSAA